MADSKISALTAATSAQLTDQLAINESGTSKMLTVQQIYTLYNGLEGIYNASGASQSPGTADFYLGGSRVLIPNATGSGSLQVGTWYKCSVSCVRTNVGSAAPIFTVRYGTAGTTSDTAICTATGATQTTVADYGVWEVTAFLLTAGSGTTATARAMLCLSHGTGAATGFVGSSTAAPAVGSGFNSTLASAGIGMSLNAGSAAAWTVTGVHSEIHNLA